LLLAPAPATVAQGSNKQASEMPKKKIWSLDFGVLLPREALDIVPDNQVYANNAAVTGAPAFRLLGNNIRFTNSGSIDNIGPAAPTPSVYAIEMVGTGGTIVNTATGSIGSLDTAAIRGSSGSDRIENAGLMAGIIDLGDGDDTIITTSGTLANADIRLGAGDDRFVTSLRNDEGNNIGGAGGRLSGGEGYDTFVLDRVASKLWYWDITGFERFEFIGNDSGASTRLRIPTDALLTLDVKGSRLNLIDTPLGAYTVTISGGWLALGGEGQGTSATVVATMTGGSGRDILEIGWGEVLAGVDLGDGADIFRLSDRRALTNWVSGGDGDDLFELMQLDSVLQNYDGGSGTDTLSFYRYTEAVSFDLSTSSGFLPGFFAHFTNFENVDGGSAADKLTGTDGVNEIHGFGGNDRIFGRGGDDRIEGGDGDDYIEASGGNDRIYGGEGNDHITYVNQDAEGGFGDDSIFGEGGNDLLTDDVGNNIIEGGAGNDRIGGSGTIRGGDGDDDIFASAYANRRLGLDVVNLTYGGDGNDIISTSPGLDFVYGEAGDDRVSVGVWEAVNLDVIDGGTGIDTLSMFGSQSPAGIYADLTQLWTGGVGHYGMVGAPSRGTLTGFERLSLSFATEFRDDISVGAAYQDDLYIQLGAGDDALYAGGGADWLYGDSGNDTIGGAGGADEIHGDIGADLLMGGDGDDRVYGENDADQLYGDGGNDKLYGGLGDDTIGGGNGNDTMQGDDGADALSGDSGNDSLFGGAGNDTLVGGAGNDGVIGEDGDDQLSGGDGDDSLVGGDGDDVLDGGSGNDSLIGGTGIDTLIGGDGNDALQDASGEDGLFGGKGDDYYYVSGQAPLIFESIGEGRDTVVADSSYYLYANLEMLLLAANAGDAFGVGNDLGNVLAGNAGSNLLIGGAGDDDIGGNEGVDSLFGLGGSDFLKGGKGVDYLVGGAGDDVLFGGDDADALYGEDGNDSLDGGDSFDTDIVVGGAGNDTLDGASSLGDYDLLDGGAGNDRYYVDTPDDLTFEALNGGTDTVYANINGAGYYLYANTENLVLEGVTPFGVGNELANRLTGNALGNYLLGGFGNDTLNGKGGNDVLFGEGGADTFVFERGTGGDVIGDFQAGVDKISLVGLGIASYAALQPAIFQVGGNTGINLGQGDFIVLNDVTNAALSASDFMFG
jgi:Ca2+-binding RTX toxin-like protein